MRTFAQRRAITFAAIAALVLGMALALASGTPARAVSTSISGTVTLPVGAPTSYFSHLYVDALRTDGTGSSQVGVASDGTYRIDGLSATTYAVLFWFPFSDTPLDYQYYNGAHSKASATIVDLTFGDATNIDVTIPWPAGSISGTVSLASGIPSSSLTGLQAVATSSGLPDAVADVDPVTGAYTIPHLLDRDYLVYFAPVPAYGDLNLKTEYYNDVFDSAFAAPVDVFSGAAVTGIDAELDTHWHFSSAPTPVITHGLLTVGSTLGINGGTWSPAANFTMRWYRDGVAISGAAGASNTYDITPADLGTNITFQLTASATDYPTVVRTSDPLFIPFAFTTAVTPTITCTGTLRSGNTLTAHRGSWLPTPSAYAYQWKRDGVAIGGAASSQYVLTSSDRGHDVTVTVTATKALYATKSKTSAPVHVPKVFTTAVTPTITGTAKSGHTLTAHHGTWAPTPAYSYRWYRNGAAIAGATHSTYKLTSSDKGKKITVKVTAKRSGYLTASRVSAAKTIAK